MDEFKNSLVNGIHKSRYVASWMRAGGCEKETWMGCRSTFADWLRTLIINDRHLTEDEIQEICYLADNGKMELEYLAREFLRYN